MRNVTPSVTPQAAKPAQSEMPKNTSSTDRSPYRTANSAAEQMMYRSIDKAPMSRDDAKPAVGNGNVGATSGAGNVRRPILCLPAKSQTRPPSELEDLSNANRAKLRAAPMGSLLGMRGPIRKSDS